MCQGLVCIQASVLDLKHFLTLCGPPSLPMSSSYIHNLWAELLLTSVSHEIPSVKETFVKVVSGHFHYIAPHVGQPHSNSSSSLWASTTCNWVTASKRSAQHNPVKLQGWPKGSVDTAETESNNVVRIRDVVHNYRRISLRIYERRIVVSTKIIDRRLTLPGSSFFAPGLSDIFFLHTKTHNEDEV